MNGCEYLKCEGDSFDSQRGEPPMAWRERRIIKKILSKLALQSSPFYDGSKVILCLPNHSLSGKTGTLVKSKTLARRGRIKVVLDDSKKAYAARPNEVRPFNHHKEGEELCNSDYQKNGFSAFTIERLYDRDDLLALAARKSSTPIRNTYEEVFHEYMSHLVQVDRKNTKVR